MRNLVLAGCWVLAAVYIIASPALRYARYRYCMNEEAIRVIEDSYGYRSRWEAHQEDFIR